MSTSGGGKSDDKAKGTVRAGAAADADLLSEIQQPLLGIRGFAQLLRDKADPGLRDHAAAILAQVERIEQILAAHRQRQQEGAALPPPFALPRVTAATPAPPPALVSRPTPTAFPSPAAAPSRRSILVVDDEEVMRSLLVSLLEPEGYTIHLAESGDEALQRIARQRYDLVISDKNLPGAASGLEVARAARAQHQDTAVILITGYASLETAQEGLEIGLVDYLEKPFDDIAEVRRRVREVLEQQRPARLPGAVAGERPLVVLVEDRTDDAAKICEAVLAAGARPQVAATVVEALGMVSTEHAAGVILSLDLLEGTPTRESVRQLRSCSDALITLSERTSMEQTVVAIRMGAIACLPRALASPQALAKELVRLFPLTAAAKK
ncbi:MAG: response regulator [Myxococcales bacterium]